MTIGIHISLDSECLSLRPLAAVLSIGAAAFTIRGGLVGTYYTGRLDTNDQIARGRVTDPATIAWWKSQQAEAAAILEGDGLAVDVGLDGLAAFINRFQGGHYHVEGVWGYGSDFDNALIQDLYRTYKHPVPWSYKLNRCGRTITKIAGNPKPESNGVQHHALDDAIWQAEYIRLALLKVGAV